MFTPAGITSQNAPSRFSLFSPQSQNAKTDQQDDQKQVNSIEISHFKKTLMAEGNTNDLKRSSYASYSSVSFPAPKIKMPISLDLQTSSGLNRNNTLNGINPPQIDIQTEPSSTKSGQTNRSFWGNANTPIGQQPGSPNFEDVGDDDTHSLGNGQSDDIQENSWNNTNNNIKQPKSIKRNLFQRVNKKEESQGNSQHSQVLLDKKANKYNKLKKMFLNPSQPPITFPNHLKEGLRKSSSLDHFYTYQQPIEASLNNPAVQQQTNQKMVNLSNPKYKIKSIISGMNNKTNSNVYPSTPSNKSSIHSSVSAQSSSNGAQKLARRDSINFKTEDKKGKLQLSKSKEQINKIQNQQQQQSRGDRVKHGLRRKSCCCGECGAPTRFEIKHQNIISMINMRHKRARLTRIFKMVNFLNKMVSREHSQMGTSTVIPQPNSKQSSTTLKNIPSSRDIKVIQKEVQQSLSLENIQTQLTIENDQKDQVPQGKLSLQSKSSRKLNSVENSLPVGITTHSSNFINDNNNINSSNSNSTIQSNKKVEDVIQNEQKKQQFRREKSMTFSGGLNLSSSNPAKRQQSKDARENSRKGRNQNRFDENEKYNENKGKSKNNSFELLDNQEKQLNFEDESIKQPWKPKTMVFDDEILGNDTTTKKRRTSFMFLVESKMKEAKRKKQADEMKFVGKTPLAVLFKLLSQGKKDSVFAQQPAQTKLTQFINSTSFNNNYSKNYNIENRKINTNSFDNETPNFTNSNTNTERNTIAYRCHSFYRNASNNNNNSSLTKQEHKIQLQSLLEQREKNFDLRESNSIRPVSMGSNPSKLRRLVLSPQSHSNLVQNNQIFNSGLKSSKSTLTLLNKTSLNKSSSRKNQKNQGESSQQSWRGPSQVSQRSTKTYITTSPPTLMNASPLLPNSPTPSTILNNYKSNISGSSSLIQLAKVPQQKNRGFENSEKDEITQNPKYLNRSSTQKIGLNSTLGNKVYLQGGFLTTREASKSIENTHSKISNQSLHNQQQQLLMLDQVDQRKPQQQQLSQQGYQRFTPYLQQIFQPTVSRSVEKNERLVLSCQQSSSSQQQQQSSSSKGFISLKPQISARSPFKLGQLPACKGTYTNFD